MNVAHLLTPIDERFNEASADDLRRIEDITQATLPKSYAAFLREFGGSTFRGEAQVQSDSGEKLGLFVFYAAAGSKNSVISDLLAHPDYSEKGLIPIADDLFNNRYVIASKTGHVHFVEYAHGMSKVTLVAPSFEAFLESVEVLQDAL